MEYELIKEYLNKIDVKKGDEGIMAD